MIYEIAAILLLPILNVLRSRRSSPSRILVVQLAKIGDFINSSTLIYALRKSYPNATISVFVAPVNKKLAEHDPIIDQVYVSDPNNYHGLFGRLSLAKAISKTNSDTVISLNCNSALSVACALAKVPQRISVTSWKKGVSTFFMKYLWDNYITHKPERLIHQTYNDLLGYCNSSADKHNFSNRIYVSRNKSAEIDKQFPQHKQKYIGIGISSANKLKELPSEKISDLIKALTTQYNARILLIGSYDDKQKGDYLSKISPQVTAVTGDYSIDQIPYLMQRLSLYVGVDSGLTYIADALSIPVVSISGPCNMSETRPLSNKVRIIQNLSLSCMPCSYIHNTARSCKIGTLECILSIKTDEIINAISEITQI